MKRIKKIKNIKKEKNIKKTKNPTLLKTAHEMAVDLYEAGAIDVVALRKYKSACKS